MLEEKDKGGIWVDPRIYMKWARRSRLPVMETKGSKVPRRINGQAIRLMNTIALLL